MFTINATDNGNALQYVTDEPFATLDLLFFVRPSIVILSIVQAGR